MEKELGNLISSRVFGLIPRVGAIIFALVLVSISAATIGIINNNDLHDYVQNVDSELTDAGQDLNDLIFGSLSAAGWLILLAGAVVISEIIAIVLFMINIEALKLVLGNLEILFNTGIVFCYIATGIACAVYASEWGGPPDGCPKDDKGEIHCDSIPLTATNALQAVFCFLQVGVFCVIGFLIIFSLIKGSRKS